MAASSSTPRIGLPCCHSMIGDMSFHVVGEKYIAAVAEGAAALPLLIPALGAEEAGGVDIEALLDGLDGLLVTGSPSNVEPRRYGGPASAAGTLHDPARDATTLPLIRAALARNLPFLALCRGMQELNVALGGSLHQNLPDLPGRFDHQAPKDAALAVRYGPAHTVRLAPDGSLAGLAVGETLRVNSLHSQAIDRLADGLAVEARAEDDTIEAVRVTGHDGFALGIQWHPEWRFHEDVFSRALFAAFGQAARRFSGRTRRAA